MDRLTILEFDQGELLYRRCSESEKINPFLSISLVDISVNRRGPNGNVLCEAEDVLFNTSPEKHGDVEKLDLAIVTLEITELDAENRYIKSNTNTRSIKKGEAPQTHECQIYLKHKKEECNYAHCAFEIYYDNIEVTFENYKETIKRNSPLKDWCKHELARMIIKEEVRINWPNEHNDIGDERP